MNLLILSHSLSFESAPKSMVELARGLASSLNYEVNASPASRPLSNIYRHVNLSTFCGGLPVVSKPKIGVKSQLINGDNADFHESGNVYYLALTLDTAYAILAIYARLEEVGYFQATRLPTNAILKEKIAHLMTQPVGRPSLSKVERIYVDFHYKAASWDKERRVIDKIEWLPGELFPTVGFVVTNLPVEPDWVVRFYNQRGTAEKHIKEGKYAFRWTRLSWKKFRDNEVRLQLHALIYNLATVLRCIELPEAMADWSLTSLQLKLIKIGASVVRPARAIRLQLAEVAVTGAILAAIRRLRASPLCALPRSRPQLCETDPTDLSQSLENVAVRPGICGFAA